MRMYRLLNAMHYTYHKFFKLFSVFLLVYICDNCIFGRAVIVQLSIYLMIVMHGENKSNNGSLLK